MIVNCVWEHNGNDTLLYAIDFVGAENYIWSLSRSADALTAVVSRLSASARLLDRYMTLLAYARKAQWFAPELIEAACRAAEQSEEPALQRVVENIRITLEEQI